MVWNNQVLQEQTGILIVVACVIFLDCPTAYYKLMIRLLELTEKLQHGSFATHLSNFDARQDWEINFGIHCLESDCKPEGKNSRNQDLRAEAG